MYSATLIPEKTTVQTKSTRRKIILHIDFNSYFASVEQQANPFLRGKPIAVGGKGRRTVDVALAHQNETRYDLTAMRLERTVVTTASKEAKKLGVKTAMSTLEALQRVPELMVIPGDPHKYSEITKRFLNILKRYSDAVEQFSTDEAFADITYAAGDYLGATMIAQMIRADIKKECGVACTASIGAGPNKLVAKLASESVKPNGLTVIRPGRVKNFILTRELQDVCGIGPRIERRLNRMGISSMRALAETPLPELVQEFKSYGYFLYFASRGIGDDQVYDGLEDPKSVGHSYTYPHDLFGASEIKKNLLALCDRVAWRLRRDGFLATHLSVYARYSGFNGVGTSKKYREPMEDGLALYKSAWKLLDEIRDDNRGVRLLGVSASGLMKTRMPTALFPKEQKMQRLLRSLDKAQTRFGSGVWQRAATLGNVFKERSSGFAFDHEI